MGSKWDSDRHTRGLGKSAVRIMSGPCRYTVPGRRKPNMFPVNTAVAEPVLASCVYSVEDVREQFLEWES